MAKGRQSEKSWERQPKESAQAFEALDLYCKMGKKRSLRKVAEKLSKSDTLIKRWSSTWNWQKRSRDYDNELIRQELEEQRKAVKKMQERQIQTAMLIQKKAVQALDQLQIEDLSPKDILSFISEGTKLERQVRSEITEASAGNSNTQGSLADTIIYAYRRRMEESNDD